MEQKPASELRVSDLGRTVRSEAYRNKNKTSKPLREREYKINCIYAHENGNILINSGVYLRSDTLITFLN